jgi:hypothetical protein
VPYPLWLLKAKFSAGNAVPRRQKCAFWVVWHCVATLMIAAV